LDLETLGLCPKTSPYTSGAPTMQPTITGCEPLGDFL
jgi:hypothetical protein